jgi:hypothetical protein
MSHEPTTSPVPVDRLTRICDAMADVFNNHPELVDGDQCAVFITDGHRSGIVLNGYDDQRDAMVDLIMHLQAVFESAGMKLDIVTIPNSPEDLM